MLPICRAPDVPVTHLQHTQDPSNAARQWGGYYALAQHFGWALGQVLGAPGGGDNGSGRPPHPRAIVLEDDLDVAVRGVQRCSHTEIARGSATATTMLPLR